MKDTFLRVSCGCVLVTAHACDPASAKALHYCSNVSVSSSMAHPVTQPACRPSTPHIAASCVPSVGISGAVWAASGAVAASWHLWHPAEGVIASHVECLQARFREERVATCRNCFAGLKDLLGVVDRCVVDGFGDPIPVLCVTFSSCFCAE